MSQVARILIIEDSPEYQQLVADAVRAEGLEAILAEDGETGLERFDADGADLVVLDVSLPGIDGLEVCRALRERAFELPIVMLTSRGDEVDRVLGLTMGANDYVVKPFFPRELRARINGLLRRAQPAAAAEPEPARMREFGDLSIDPDRREVAVVDEPVQLTPTEYAILDALSENVGIALSRGQLMERVWGPAWYGDEHVIDVHVSKLRRKLGDEPRSPRWIETVRGFGFRMKR